MPETESSKRVKAWIGLLIAILILVYAQTAWKFVHDHVWGEREGVTRIADCRSVISVKEGSYDTWFKTFTCSYVRSKSGKLIGGRCVAVETDGPVCKKVYGYEKRSELTCSDPKLPYIGVDEMCHSDPQIGGLFDIR